MSGVPGPVDLGPAAQRWLVAAASITVFVEVASLFGLIPVIAVAGYGLSPSIVPAGLLVAVLGRRLVGRACDAHAEVVFWAASILALVAVGVTFLRIGQATILLAVLGAAFDEELVYRLAVPLLITLALVGWGWRQDRARVAGFLAASVWFVLLPGHRAQMGSLAEALPFLAFAALASLVVYRSGSVLAVITMHLCTDLLNLLAIQNRLGPIARVAMLVALFLLLVMAYGAPQGRRRGSGEPPADDALPGTSEENDAVIDLRDRSTEAAGAAAPEGDENLPVR